MTIAKSAPTPKSSKCPHCTGLLRQVRDGDETYVQCLNCGRIITEDDFRIDPTPTDDPDPPAADPDPIDVPPPYPQTSDDLQELTAIRWPDAITCPHCLSRRVQQIIGAVDQSIMCDACDRVFDVRTKTPMADTNIPDAVWVACLQSLTPGPHTFDVPTIAARLQPHHRSHAQEAHDIVIATSPTPDVAPTTRHFLQFRPPAPPPPRPEPRSPIPPDRQPGEETQMLSPTTLTNDAPDPDRIHPPAETDAPPAETDAPPPDPEPEPPPPDRAEAAATEEDERRAAQILTDLRWPHRIICPKCNSTDTSTNWNLRIPNYCRECTSKFSFRTNSLTHKSSTTPSQWLQILEMFANQPPQPKYLRELGNSSAVASNISRRIKTAINLWNQRHGQKRRTLSPSEILSVNYLWDHGQEPEYRPPEANPTSQEPEEPAAPPAPEQPAPAPTEPVNVAEDDPAAVATDPDPHPDPETNSAPAADKDPDVENDPDPEPTIQQVLDLLTQLDQRIASLERPAIQARQTTHSCPVCGFDKTNRTDRHNFNACPICGCVFPNTFTVQTIEIQKPAPASPQTNPVPLININIHQG